MINRIRSWLATRSMPTSMAPKYVSKIVNTQASKEELEELVDKAVSEKFVDKNNVVRDVQYEALEKLSKIVKIYSALISLPVGIIVAFFAFEGVKDARSFLRKVEPRIKAAQSAIESEQGRLKTQQTAIDESEENSAALRENLNGQQRLVDEFSNKIAGLKPQLDLLKKQLDSLNSETNSVVAQSNENRLVDDFASFATGATSLLLDNKVYKGPENPAGRPVVYLTSYASITSDHDISDIHRFSDGLTSLSFKFVHGYFTLQRGKNTAAATMIPNAYCTQVIYYDAAYEAAAKQISTLIAASFHLKNPITKLISVNSAQIDQVSKTAIQMSGINIAASVAIPSADTCDTVLSQY